MTPHPLQFRKGKYALCLLACLSLCIGGNPASGADPETAMADKGSQSQPLAFPPAPSPDENGSEGIIEPDLAAAAQHNYEGTRAYAKGDYDRALKE